MSEHTRVPASRLTSADGRASRDKVVTREEILDGLCGPDHVAGSNLVDQQVPSLRVCLQCDRRRPRFIATVPGRGYRFMPTFREDETAPRQPETHRPADPPPPGK
jgi:DNA-binding winged helix-turn-helix (wHTH) protein